jgi:hypothetical protein
VVGVRDRPSTLADPPAAAGGARLAALSLWLRLVPAVLLLAIASLVSRAAEMLASGPTLPAARVLAPTDRRGGGAESDASPGEDRM